MSKAAELAALIGSQTALSNRNLVINGAMQVAQRGTSATAAGSSGVYLIDRFKGFASGGGAYTMEQSTTVPNNTFKNSAKLVVTTADSSIASSDYYSFNYNIEGQDIVPTGYGTSDAKSLSLSFQVRSSVTGTYSVTCYNDNGTRGYINTFSISSADTWTEVNLTWPGDTGGTWNKDNTRGMTIRFDLGGGSSGHGTANQWTTSGTFAANRTSGSVDWIANNGATFYITGVQLEVGEQATPFEHRTFGDELLRCQRYFYSHVSGNEETIANAAAYSSTQVFGTLHFPVSMRITPSLAAANGTNYYRFYRNGSNTDFDEFGFNDRSKNSMTIYKAGLSGLTAGHSGWLVTNNASASLTFDSEL